MGGKSFFDEQCLSGVGPVNAHDTVLDREPTLDEPTYRQRIDTVFLVQHPRRKRRFGVPCVHGYRRLRDDRRRCVCRPGNAGSSDGWMLTILPE